MIHIFNSWCQQTRVEYILFRNALSNCFVYCCIHFEDTLFMVNSRVRDLVMYVRNLLFVAFEFDKSKNIKCKF